MADVLTSTRWCAGTRIQLLNVPWDSAYRDVVAWKSIGERDQWFLAKCTEGETNGAAATIDNARYVRPNEGIKVPIPYSTAYKYNYCVVTNPLQPPDQADALRTYCYFISAASYVAPGVTQLTLQLDVMSTYGPGVTFGRCYVESGHAGLCAGELGKLAVDGKGLPDGARLGKLLSEYTLAPEGLDTGSEYLVAQRKYYYLGAQESGGGAVKARNAWVLVESTADLLSDPGTVDDPAITTATGGLQAGTIPSGAAHYLINGALVETFFRQLSAYSWVSQCITSVMLVPSAAIGTQIDESKAKGHLFGKSENVELYSAEDIAGSRGNAGAFVDLNADDPYDVWEAIRAAWSVFGHAAWNLPKLFTYPYTVIELTAYNGASVFLKPQDLASRQLILEAALCPVPGNSRLAVIPRFYGSSAQTTEPIETSYSILNPDGTTGRATIEDGTFLDSALVIADFPQCPIVNNAGQIALAQTAHTRAYNYQAAGWVLDKANASAQLSYDQGQRALGAADANQALSQQISRYQIGAGVMSGFASTMGQAFGGNLVGAGTTALNTVMNGQVADLGREAQQQQYQNTRDVTSANLDQNLSYAQWANQGDYKNTIQALNASVQDTALQAPSMSGQLGGDMLNWLLGLVGVTVRIKRVNNDAAARLISFFSRYGYKVSRMCGWLDGKTISDMQVMTHASYWQLQETYLQAAFANETEKNAIRGIFEKGVTLYDRPESIGSVDFQAQTPRKAVTF